MPLKLSPTEVCSYGLLVGLIVYLIHGFGGLGPVAAPVQRLLSQSLLGLVYEVKLSGGFGGTTQHRLSCVPNRGFDPSQEGARPGPMGVALGGPV